MRFVNISSTSLLAILFLLVLNHCAPAVPDALAPDLVLHNGKIVTVDEDFSIAQAVAIRNGRARLAHGPAREAEAEFGAGLAVGHIHMGAHGVG